MTKLVDQLFALQRLVQLGAAATPAQRQEIEALRVHIPSHIFAQVQRQLKSGHQGIVYARNGICGECHLRLPHAMVYMLSRSNEVMACESCGTFVTLAPEARAILSVPKVTKVRKAPEVVPA